MPLIRSLSSAVPHNGRLLGSAIALLVTPEFALAADKTPPMMVGAPWIVMLIAILSRKSAVGGWLLIYYFSTIASLVLSAILFALGGLIPAPGDGARDYLLARLTDTPFIVALFCQTFFALRLLKHRTEQALHLHSVALLAGMATAALAYCIDAQYFPNDIGVALYQFGYIAVWSSYWFTSRRVEMVFRDNQWNFELFTAEKKRSFFMSFFRHQIKLRVGATEATDLNYCHKCRKELLPEASFCSSCGATTDMRERMVVRKAAISTQT